MDSSEIRKRFLSYFEKRGHAVIPSASLIPEGDASTLFTTAGMQPLVPYLLGQKHPKGTRLVNVQKCLRTGDIDEVGDNTHLTFFEMLGNWSLGDYWKKEAISWSYELLTSGQEGFGLDPKRLYVTVFEGDANAPRDEESFEIWKSAGVPEHRIYFRGAKDNWWSPGENGPCGPDTEMFYDITGELGDLSAEAFEKADGEQKIVEIWNDVFMEYEKKGGIVIGKLKQQNVDTGAGLERLATILQGKSNVFETDLFTPILETLPKGDERSRRIVADHIRAAVFLIADGILPDNSGRGYVLRRLIRRTAIYLKDPDVRSRIVETILSSDIGQYHDIVLQTSEVIRVIEEETEKFSKTVEKGMRELLKKSGEITGIEAFNLYQTHGLHIEIIEEFASELGGSVNRTEFEEEMKKHQEKSRTASAGMFKGGLADHSEQTVKLHTAHHLLLAALQKVLGKEVKQRGSNITGERLRIDFTFDRKLSDEEKKAIEDKVNEWIGQGLQVIRREMPREEAEKIGAEMEFGQKYPDVVSVYFVEDSKGNVISKEFCGGPHVANTRELGLFKIQKEEASSAGVRRIKAILS